MPFLRHDSEENLGSSSIGYGYSLLSYEFHLEVEGLLVGVFQTLSGGEIAVTTIEHDIVYESGASTTLLIPGTTSFAPFKLTKGFANYYQLYSWMMLASAGRIAQARRDGSVIMRRHGQDYLRWNFYNAWPTKLTTFNFSQSSRSTKTSVAITIAPETLELAEVGPPTEPPSDVLSEADLETYFEDIFTPTP